ncbi:MAG: alpha/beta hydrolase [Caulobacterales bacterium]
MAMGAQYYTWMDRGDGVRLAYAAIHGRKPTFVWLSGFKSDMAGAKAQALAEWAEQTGQSFLRFDYSGHGVSGGAFEDGTIGRWLADALTIIDAQSDGPLVLIGSSMGGWISLLVACARPERIKALLLIAPAPDFTERMLADEMDDAARAVLETTGRWERPSDYDPEPYVITRALIEDGRNHLILDKPIAFEGAVRILQGQQDDAVPWAHALLIAEKLKSQDVAITLVKDGDHRLSRPQDIVRLTDIAAELADLVR